MQVWFRAAAGGREPVRCGRSGYTLGRSTWAETGETMQRIYELYSFSNVRNKNAFCTSNDYSHVTSIVHMERIMKWAGLTTAAVCSAWVVLCLLLPHQSLFVNGAPLKY